MENTGQQWLIFLLGAAVLHGCWLAMLLFLKNLKNNKAWLLATVFILVSFHLVNYLLYLTKTIYLVPHAVGIFYPTLFLIGPAFYFFIKNNLQPAFKFQKINLLHIIPFVITTVLSLQTFVAPVAYKIKIIDWFLDHDNMINISWWFFVRGNDFNYHIMAYFGAAWWLAKSTELRLQETSFENIAHVRWLKRFSLIFILLLLVELIIKILSFALSTPGCTIEYILASVMAIGIHIVGYHALGQMKFQPIPTESQIIQNGKISENGKYKTSPLTEEQIALYNNKLLLLMLNEKLYLTSSLKISDLANALQLPSHHLSQVLNEGMQTSYYDFINGYRIEEAKQKLKGEKYRHYSIYAIGMECGFTNKTTFNRTFKKITGMTPSEYMKENSEI